MTSINAVQHAACTFAKEKHTEVHLTRSVTIMVQSLIDLLVEARAAEMTGEDLLKAASEQLRINKLRYENSLPKHV